MRAQGQVKIALETTFGCTTFSGQVLYRNVTQQQFDELASLVKMQPNYQYKYSAVATVQVFV